MKAVWTVRETTREVASALGSLRDTISLPGSTVNASRMSKLSIVEIDDSRYYVKTYFYRGKGLRKYLGRSRVRAEWENACLMHALGISVVKPVAWGEENCGGYRGVLVTRELPQVRDLASLVATVPDISRQPWFDEMISGLAQMVRRLHDAGFVHYDLKWRNILAGFGDDPELYIIDCPAGRQFRGPMLAPFLKRGIIKDLACLDIEARRRLSRTKRLKFYKLYAGIDSLDSEHKARIRRIVSFFQGREQMSNRQEPEH